MQINKNNLDSANEQLIQQLLSINTTSLHKTILTISIVGAGGKTHLSYWLANFFKQLGLQVCITTSTKMYLPDKSCVKQQGIDHIFALADDIDKLAKQLNTSASITFLYQEQLTNNNITEPVKVKGLSPSTLKEIQQKQIFDVLIVEADGAKHLPIKAPENHEPCIVPGSDIVFAVTGAEAVFSAANSNNIQRWPQFSALTACSEGMQIDHQILKCLLESPQGMFKGAPADALKIWVINKYDLTSDADALLVLAKDLLEQLPLLKSIWLTQLNSASAIKKVLINL